MHELSIVSGLVESVLEFATARGASKVLAVRLAIGELTRLEPEQLRFCYTAVSGNTLLEGSDLEIEPVPAQVACAHCGYRGAPKYWDDGLLDCPVPTLQCPACGKSVEAAGGHACVIKSVKYVT